MLFDRPVRPETYAAIRFGLGFPARGAPLAPDAMLARLEAPDRMAAEYPFVPFMRTLELAGELRAAGRARRTGMGGEAAFMAARAAIDEVFLQTFLDDLVRAVETDDPFRERLVKFWLSHFATRSKSFRTRTGPSGFEAEAIRPHLTGRFGDMLKAALTHPFMLDYLDQTASVGPNSAYGRKKGLGLNENLAREAMELHTLGVDAGYDQQDVTELAELLTGLHVSRKTGFEFLPGRAEPGAETVLGRRYGGRGKARLSDIHEALDDLAAHPAAAGFLCTKLAAQFVADRPDPDLVAHMAAAYRRSGGVLLEVYAAMLEHPAAWSGFGAKVKWPFEFLATGLRALGVRADHLREIAGGQVRKRLVNALARMGQPYRAPPGPDGWPDRAEAWVHPHGLAARIGWAMAIARRAPVPLPEPADFARRALGDAAGERLVWAAGAAESRAEGIGLVLASAEFNRR